MTTTPGDNIGQDCERAADAGPDEAAEPLTAFANSIVVRARAADERAAERAAAMRDAERAAMRGMSFDELRSMRWRTCHEPAGYVWLVPARVPDEIAERDASAGHEAGS
jgi:hypothetical protein